MHGEINVAAMMAIQQYKRPVERKTHPPTTIARPEKTANERARDRERDGEWLDDYLHRQHRVAMQMSYEEFGAAKGDQSIEATVWKRWGKTLEDALERRAKHQKWLKWEYMPRAAAWHRRMGNLPAFKG